MAMMWKNLSLRTQLGTGFAVVVGCFLLTLLVVAGLLSQLKTGVRDVAQHGLPLLLAVDQMDLSRSEVQQFLTDVSATHDPAGYKEADASAAEFRTAVAAARKLLVQHQDSTRLAELDTIEARFNTFDGSGRKMAEAYLRDGREAGNLLMKGSDGKPGFDQDSEALSTLLTKFRQAQMQYTRQGTATDMQAADTMHAAMLWGGLAATVVAIAMASWIVHLILAQLGGEPRVAAKLMGRVGAGDLSTHILVPAGDTRSLMAHLQSMQAGLGQVVSTVRQQAQSLALASAENQSGNADLAERTASQAGSLQEAAASLEQFSSTVQQNVNGARQANERVKAASATAVKGGELVARFVQTMEGINEASQKIADIIGVIDGIAFQTNILALNAAVEAARAGEQGRGFAVVASEVRSLAGRSAEAARAVKSLIGASVERVEQGTALVAQARSAMAEVVDGINGVSQTMDAISTASTEQGIGVSQVASAVSQMDQMTQQNAALVEQSAAAAASLAAQARALAQAVSVFRLESDMGAPQGAHAVPAPA
jgi:methyl-accepting chemotaxis protein